MKSQLSVFLITLIIFSAILATNAQFSIAQSGTTKPTIQNTLYIANFGTNGTILFINPTDRYYDNLHLVIKLDNQNTNTETTFSIGPYQNKSIQTNLLRTENIIKLDPFHTHEVIVTVSQSTLGDIINDKLFVLPQMMHNLKVTDHSSIYRGGSDNPNDKDWSEWIGNDTFTNYYRKYYNLPVGGNANAIYFNMTILNNSTAALSEIQIYGNDLIYENINGILPNEKVTVPVSVYFRVNEQSDTHLKGSYTVNFSSIQALGIVNCPSFVDSSQISALSTPSPAPTDQINAPNATSSPSIPEFPVWAILPLFIIAALTVFAYRRKKPQKIANLFTFLHRLAFFKQLPICKVHGVNEGCWIS